MRRLFLILSFVVFLSSNIVAAESLFDSFEPEELKLNADYQVGKTCYETEQFNKAIDYFQLALEDTKTDAENYYIKREISFVYADALRSFVKNFITENIYGISDMTTAEAENEVISLFRTFSPSIESLADAEEYYKKGYGYYSRNEYFNAAKYYFMAFTSNPSNYKSLLWLSKSLYKETNGTYMFSVISRMGIELWPEMSRDPLYIFLAKEREKQLAAIEEEIEGLEAARKKEIKESQAEYEAERKGFEIERKTHKKLVNYLDYFLSEVTGLYGEVNNLMVSGYEETADSYDKGHFSSISSDFYVAIEKSKFLKEKIKGLKGYDKDTREITKLISDSSNYRAKAISLMIKFFTADERKVEDWKGKIAEAGASNRLANEFYVKALKKLFGKYKDEMPISHKYFEGKEGVDTLIEYYSRTMD
ncbi:hypothetical protein KKB18_11630 [bacterium]|nr:hypothetical protein [bacterium]